MLPNLKLLRNEFRISQQRLADEIGVSQQSINQYENHDIEPDIAVLTRLADFFLTSIDYIVGRSALRSPTTDINPVHLSQDETEVLKRYKSLTSEQKNCIMVVLETLQK
jgi:DNA-binding XRE family transcriptional regulator